VDKFHANHTAGNQTISPSITPIQIKPMCDTSTQNHPAVTKIQIDYEDGSHDVMELLDAEQGLYNWDRKHPAGKKTRGGLYTANRIAAHLFKTGLEGHFADDQCLFQEQAAPELLHQGVMSVHTKSP